MSHALFLLIIVIGAVGLVMAYRRSKQRASLREADRSWLDYVLLWPLLFENSSKIDRSRRLLTPRELIGWGIVAALILIGFVFF